MLGLFRTGIESNIEGIPWIKERYQIKMRLKRCRKFDIFEKALPIAVTSMKLKY